MNLKNGKVLTSKSVGTRPLSYEKRIYRAAVSQRLRNTAMEIVLPLKLVRKSYLGTGSPNIFYSSMLFDKQQWLCSGITHTVLCYRNTWLCDYVEHWTSWMHLEQAFDHAIVWDVQNSAVYCVWPGELEKWSVLRNVCKSTQVKCEMLSTVTFLFLYQIWFELWQLNDFMDN